MQVTKGLVLKMFEAASILRWNDKMRPIELVELDKQAHKMTIAYILGKMEEDEGKEIDWISIIEGGIFEFMHRIVLKDIKPPIREKMLKNATQRKEINKWVAEQLSPFILNIEDGKFDIRFQKYFEKSDSSSLERQILRVAHFYATQWEFEFIKRANPDGYEIKEIEKAINKEHEKYYSLKAVENLIKYHRYNNIKKFINLCGELRFQIRWSQTPRVPRTSVLGHMLIVAILTYLYSLEIGACKQRCVNNYSAVYFMIFQKC